MILIRKIFIYSACFFSCCAVALISIYGYFTITGISHTRDIELKYYAENFIYLALIFITAVILIYIYAILNSHQLIRQLEKASEIIRKGENQIGDYFRKLGPIGDKISVMLFDLNRLNEAKSLKISTLSNLINFLADNIDLGLFILDATGKITNCSKKALVNFEREKAAIVDKSIEDFVIGLNFTDLLLELKEKRIPITRKGLKAFDYTGDFVFYPIFNSVNKVGTIVCILESEEILDKLSKKSEQIRTEKRSFAKRIFDSLVKK